MLNLDNIAQDFDKLETAICNSGASFEQLLLDFKGFNLINDDNFKQFDFDDGDYTFTIDQEENGKPYLVNNFIVWIGADGIEFERS